MADVEGRDMDSSPPPGTGTEPSAAHAARDADVAAIASLAEPTRRTLYLYARAQPSAVSRDEAAVAVGVPRHLAKFHLDRLAKDGLLEVEYGRRSGRQGPGAGRPAKLYRRSSRELAVILPERRYDLAGELMARAITDAARHSPPADEALRSAASQRGRALGDQARALAGPRASRAGLLAAVGNVLDEYGYQTRADPAGLTFANCPFHALARDFTTLICGMNLALMEGLLAGLEGLRLSAQLDPAQGRCCVRLAVEGRVTM